MPPPPPPPGLVVAFPPLLVRPPSYGPKAVDHCSAALCSAVLGFAVDRSAVLGFAVDRCSAALFAVDRSAVLSPPWCSAALFAVDKGAPHVDFFSTDLFAAFAEMSGFISLASLLMKCDVVTGKKCHCVD